MIFDHVLVEFDTEAGGFRDLDRDATVAVGLGSRGIHAIEDVAATTVEFLDGAGFNPVIVPAMGSHGGATAEGQRSTTNEICWSS